MPTFTLAGSKGGAGRTTTSALLALGLSDLGMAPLHVQILRPREVPVFDGVADLPFAARWRFIDLDGYAEGFDLANITSEFPEHPTIVVDLCSISLEGLASPSDGFLLIPMLPGFLEVETAEKDFVDACGRAPLRLDRAASQVNPVCIVPVAWDGDAGAYALESVLASHGAFAGLPAGVRVLRPGLPRIARKELDPLLDGQAFRASAGVRRIARQFAETALSLARGS